MININNPIYLPVRNNIIYYNEHYHSNFPDGDIEYFERATPGAFMVCQNIKSLEKIKDEILNENKKDKDTIFNMIITGSSCVGVMEFLKKNNNFEKCIKNMCIYCMNLKKYSHLKEQYPILGNNIYNRSNDVMAFINNTSSLGIKPFPYKKIITYAD